VGRGYRATITEFELFYTKEFRLLREIFLLNRDGVDKTHVVYLTDLLFR
jgi:hypothetical protein